MGLSTVNNKPAGLGSRVRLDRMWCQRNWDMLSVAPSRCSMEVPTVPTIQGGTTGVCRTAKEGGPSQGPG